MLSPHPLHVYADSLRGARGHAGRVTVRMSDGVLAPLEVQRYLAAADDTDESLLSAVAGPVLDIGCGPGRHLEALARRGVFALGVDLSPAAVALARGRGGRAIVASVFDELPGAGSWRTALLLDGNIGIGGAPVRLLERVGGLLAADGAALVELDPPGSRSARVRARLETAGETSAWFAWARMAYEDLPQVAEASGLRVAGRWTSSGRWFARLLRLRPGG